MNYNTILMLARLIKRNQQLKQENNRLKGLNRPLTLKQKRFCRVYAKCLNATKSYQAVYGTKVGAASTCASRLLTRPNVKHYVNSLVSQDNARNLIKYRLKQLEEASK